MSENIDFDTLGATPYLTSDLPGIGGKIRLKPEDFRVEEIPLYAASGDGDHLYLRVQKTGLNTSQMVDMIANHFAISARDIGVAGQKDKHAVTTQWISIPWRPLGIEDPELAVVKIVDGVQVLEAIRHTNKLKMGHLSGNRFEITIRESQPDSFSLASEIVKHVREIGLPNYYGPQRFGNGNKTFWMGWHALRTGELDRSIQRNQKLKTFSLNAVQSAIFNRVLAERVLDGALGRALVGDILEKSAGGLARVDALNLEEMNDWVGSHLATPTGPMFGSRMLIPTDEVLEREAKAKASFLIEDEHLGRYRSVLRGERRPLRISASELELVELADNALQVRFLLPSGSYATVLLRELMKNDASE